ncbi:MAG: DNA helicase RecQ [Firmicutes bacterium]|jgi:ATP-dependent DNA helicase RecQ|nr:DNA helicase RecQ [Bacillota bacterium]
MLERAQALLKEHFGYTAFKPGQEKVISSLLAGGDTLAIMPTGAGKSVCYQVPALIFGGITLVISPLIALMKDQVDGMTASGIPATFINSSLRSAEVGRRLEQAGQGRFKLVYVAPERLEIAEFQALAAALDISFVAIDEAHCVSQWGHDFRPSYRKIAQFIHSLEQRPVLGAFTATATDEIRKDIIDFLDLREPRVFVSGFDRENLYFAVVRGENKKDFVLDYVNNNRNKPGIIYAATRREVDNLYELLQEKGYPCGRYHAGMSAVEREENQEAFIHDDVTVMVATNAFGMGIDKSNVRYVLHYNMPKNMEAYYQEAGRAGRDGEPGECILLFGAQDILLQKFMIGESVYNPRRKANEYCKLQQIAAYCHTSRCLRRYILEYFGEQEVPERCERCGNCSDDGDLIDVTVEAQKILSCVVRVKERYGATIVAEVLKGSKNKRVLQLRFDRLSTYGIMAGYTLQEIKDLINLLAAEDYLALSGGEYPVVKLGRRAAAVLKSGEKVWQRKCKRKAVQVDEGLFEKLRLLRKEIAAREGVPPYLVFADSTLRALSEQLPRDREEMLKVKGVGQYKLEKFGDEFLKLIRDYVKTVGESC